MEQGTSQQYPREYSGYTLLESIGQGGMSAIDLAQTTVTDAQYVRFVVIKRMHAHLGESDESYIRMFQDEARISAELQHANIAQVYNFGQYENEFFMVMEYVPGFDLRELQRGLANHSKGIPIRITLKILHDVLQALDYAHHRVDTYGQSLNIVHRDVNPRNVMLSTRGEVKLIDFGVAKADNRMDKTVGHTIKGKFAYMAPEQIDPSIGNIDGRADLFAVGLMFYEMIAGQRPFHGMNEIQIMHKIMSVDIPDMPMAPDHPQPEQLVSIFNKVMSKNPHDRYATAGEMALALQQASSDCGGMANTADLATFLKTNMPAKFEAIAARLSQYKTNATMSSGMFATIEPKPYVEEFTPSVGTLQHPLLQNQLDATEARRPPQQQPLVENTNQHTPPPYGIFAIGGLLIFGIGFASIAYVSQPPPTTPILSPTKTKKLSSSNSNDGLDIKKPPSGETPALNTSDKLSAPKEDAKQISKESTTVQNAVDTPKNTATKSPKQSSTSKKTKAATKSNAPTTSTSSKTKAKNTRQMGTAVSSPKSTSSTTNTDKPIVKEAKDVTDTKETKTATHSLYLMVGVESGTRGLPVLYKGFEITQTGAKKSVTLPIGEVQLEIRNPSTGASVYQRVTIQPGDPILTVQVHRM